MRKSRLCSLVGLVAVAVAAAACADAGLHSPIAPSALPSPEQTVAATDRTPVVGGSALADWARYSTAMTAAGGQMVEGSDVITGVSGACPDRTVTVRGVPVMLNSGTMFGAGTTCAALAAGVTVHIRGLLTIENGVYVLLANSLSIDTATGASGDGGAAAGNQGPGRGRHAAGEGTVTSVRGTCPSVSMVIRGYSVTTSVQTVFVGGGCGDLRPGVTVEVAGDAQGDTLVAESIEFKR